MITYSSTTLTSYNTITKIEVYYYKSTSSTDLAGGSWSTTKPIWENGKYIWQKIRTTYEGKLANGQFYSESDPVNITGQQGATGTAAYSYKLNASDTIVGRTKTGQYTVNEITFTATYKQGTGAVTAYAGRFKIETTLNGTDWTTAVSSTANESSKKFTIPENIIAIKCSLYQAGGLTVLLDIMTVPVVKDGVDAIGLRNTIPYYLASDKDTGVTRDEVGWSRYTPQLTADKKYLWVYYASRYSEGNSEPELIDIKDDVVSFENHGEISPSEGCVVDINPVQDCNGYDKPWIKGTGNNKLPSPKEETIILNGITAYCDGAGKYTLTGTATAATTIKFDLDQTFIIPPSTETDLYFFNSQTFPNGEVIWLFWNNTSTVDSWRLTPINRNNTNYTGMANKSCNTVGFTITSGTAVDMTLSPALLLKGNTTFEPYENICPITGWTNIDINQYGKNWLQLPEYNEIKTYEVQAGYHKVPIKVLPNTDYYLHTEYLNDYTSKGKNNCYVLMTASPNGNTGWKAIGHSSNGIVDGVMKSTSDGYLFLKVHVSCSQEVYDELKNNCETMLAIGTTATAYEPYKEQDYIYDVRFDDNLSLIKTDNEPYQFRQNIVPIAFQVDRFEDEIVGGSIVWNQMVQNGNFADGAEGWRAENKYATLSVADGIATVTLNTASPNAYTPALHYNVPSALNHVYLIDVDVMPSKTDVLFFGGGIYSIFGLRNIEADVWNSVKFVMKATSVAASNALFSYLGFRTPVSAGVAEGDTLKFRKIMVHDLTQMFGSTIADYIYNLETATAGAGVTWFRKYFPKNYYEYNAGELMHVSDLQSHDMVGFNAFDASTVKDGYFVNGNYVEAPNSEWSVSGFIPVVPGQTYHCNFAGKTGVNTLACYDINKAPLALSGPNVNNYTIPENGHYVRLNLWHATKPLSESSFNLSWSGTRDGEYEPYVKHSYPLDSSLTLRGIPKLSTDGKLYYDGDHYKSDGTVERRYGIVDLGTLDWGYTSLTYGGVTFNAFRSGANDIPAKIHAKNICEKYTSSEVNRYAEELKNLTNDKTIWAGSAYWSATSKRIVIHDDAYSDAASFKAAMSGVYLVYELATPITEKGAPYQSLQTIDPYGTEEYVTNSIIPVGHETKYYSRAVYGGQLDMTNGILTVDRVRLTLTGDPTKEAWYLYSPDNYNADCFNIAIPNKKIGNSTSICDKFSNIITCWGANGDNKYGVYSDHLTLNRFYFRQPNADITTIDKWKKWLSENPVTVCYELADPIIYQLTPQELIMLAGQNYICSDSGQTNIRYYDDQTSTEPRIDYTFMSAYDTAQMINNAVGTLEAPYTELEWVESTGKQYVYLDWKPPIKTWGFEADFICRNLISSTGANVWNEETNANGYGSVFGVRNASQVNDCLLTSYASGVVRIGGGNIGDIGFERNKRIVMKMHGTTFTKPDGTTKTLTRLNETANKPYWNMTIFALHQGLRQAGYGSLVEPSSTRIYSLKFFDGDTLTVDLVGAIRKSDRITGLYDKVSKHFYPAPGMLYGNEVGDIGEIASIKQSMLKTNPQTIVVNKNRTRMWEATVPFDHLEDGQKLTVTYSYGNVVNSVETEKLAGWTDTSSNQQIYLKLTLSNGNQTDWIPCYYSNTGRLTTHYGSGIPIVFTYRENMLAGASETSSGYAVMRGFYADANYDSNTIYTQYASAVKAGTNGVKRYTLIMRDSDNTYSSFINQANTLGTTKTVYTGGFVLGKIYYSSGGAEYATGANTSSIWSTYQVDLRYDFNITTSGATALTLYKPVYLVGTVHDDDGLFYLDTTQWWTQTEPTSEDGKVYVFIGQAYSAYQSWLAVDNTAYQYYDGKFMSYETVRTLKSITTLQETLENQIDGKVETWCQINDPATAWTTVDLKNQHDGDLWYYIGESNTTYKNNTTYKYTASTGKWTAYSASTDLFDRIDSKSTVYYGKPSAITQNLEVGDYLVDNTDGSSYRWDGSKWVKVTDYKTTITNAIDNIEIGGRNLARNTKDIIIDRIGSAEGSRAEYAAFDLGCALPLNDNDNISISFDLYMVVRTAKPMLNVYNTNNQGVHQTCAQTNVLSGNSYQVGDVIDKRVAFVSTIHDRESSTLPHDYLEFYSTYGTNNFFRISNLKVEKGNKPTDWTPAPEDVTRGTGFYSITTAPTAYTTTISGFIPSYRIALSTVKSESGLEEVMIGDVIQQGYNTYPVGYVDASYVYLGSANSIRGATGATGLNNAQVILYRRFASAPSGTDIAPTGDVTYTFATGKAVNNLNSWTQNIPTGSNPVYMIAASASNTSATDVIPKTEWSAPVKILENGQNGGTGSAGADGYNQATIFLYQRKSGTAPSKPSSAVTYTFSSGALSSTPTGWSRTIPTNDGNPCYVTTATAVAKTATYSIPANSWSDVVILSQDGEDGTSITITSTSVKYQKGTSGTTAPTGTWGTSIPSVGENEFLWTQTIVNYSDSSKTESYSVSRNAKNGTNGTSPTVSSTTVEYQQSTGGTTPPTGTWTTSVPTATAGQYMWTRTTVKYSDNKTAVSYSVSKNGTNGTSPTAYHLIVSHGAINKSQAGVYNPTTITLTSKSQTGNGALNNYNGRFKIETTTDNSTWTQDSASSTADESSKTYTIPANIKAVRFSLYLAGGFTTLLDQQTVPIVIDGAKGDNGDDAYTIVLTNEAHTFPAGVSAALAGSATSSVMTYKGGIQVVCFAGSTSSATSISTGTTGLTCAINNNNSKNVSLTFTATTSLTTRAGTVTIPITVDNKSFSKTFTWSLANQGAKGDNGVSVTNVTSTNNTADGGTSVVTVTLSDGTTKTFNVKNGSKGNPGATGATAQWYYGTALTHISGTATLVATSTSGAVVGSMYLNTQTSLVYKCTAISTNNTWTYAGDLTTGVINNIEIGGRNLLRWTTQPKANGTYSIKDPQNTDGWYVWYSKTGIITRTENGIKFTHTSSSGQSGIVIPLAFTNAVIGEIEYTLSFKYRTNLTSIGIPYLLCQSNSNIKYKQAIAITPSETEWQYFTAQIQWTSTGNINTWALLLPYSAVIDGWIEIQDKSMKLEKGNKATDWTPAPEDVEKEISTLCTDLQSQIDEKIQTFYQSTNPASSWTTAELRTPHDGDLWYYTGATTSTYTKDNVYRYNASNNTWSVYSASGELFDKVDGKSTIYYGATSDDYTGVETGDYLVDSTDGSSYRWDGSKWVKLTDYKTAIDNIEIGGRNLLRGTKTQDTSLGNYKQNATAIDETLFGCTVFTSSLRWADIGFDFKKQILDRNLVKAGDSVTYSVWAKTDDTEPRNIYGVWVGSYYGGTTIAVLSSEWTQYSKTFVITEEMLEATSAIQTRFECNTDCTEGKYIYWAAPKLERGTKATDWTPAPEDTETAISNAQDTANTALNQSVEYIVGTQTAATGSWKGVTTESELRDGKTIMYKLPFAGSGNASLQLTLSDGSLTENIPVYMIHSTSSNDGALARVTTHYPAGSVIQMTYDSNANYWKTTGYNSNINYYDRSLYAVSLAASTAIAAVRIAVLGTDGKLHILNTTAFDIKCPPLYVSTAYSTSDVTKATKRSTNYSYWGSAFALTSTHAVTGAVAGEPVYIVGSLEEDTFTPTTTVLTCTEPTSEDNLVYMRLGRMTTTANAVLEAEHPFYTYYDGAFRLLSEAEEIKATKSATNYISSDNTGIMVADMTDGVEKLPSDTTLTGSNVFITAGYGSGSTAVPAGVHIRDGKTDIARFGATVKIGGNDNTYGYLYEDYHSLQIIDRNENNFFYISDLRNSDGVAQLTEVFYGNGIDTQFKLSFTATSRDYTVVTSDSSVPSLKQLYGFSFENAPAQNVKITVTYESDSQFLKAYTLGKRADSSNIGAYSFAEGYNIKAEGNFSHAEGYQAKASGYCAHAEGSTTTAEGWYSHAEGIESQAIGTFSHAEGYSEARGSFSHAQNETIAQSPFQTTLGKHNIIDNDEKYPFIIGNGSDYYNARSNALTVSWDGDIKIDTTFRQNGSIGSVDIALYNAITALGWEGDVIV